MAARRCCGWSFGHSRAPIACIAGILLLCVLTPLREASAADGSGAVAITGELKQWHKVTLTLDGPFAREADTKPNPFLDYRFQVTFTHESGSPAYTVPGYFAADGKAAETSADAGTKWRAHLSPDKAGKWNYSISMLRGKFVAVDNDAQRKASPAIGASGTFTIAPTDKTGRDLRGKGRLQYVGRHHLRFAGTGEYFLKAGADAPETLLAYADIDGTVALKPKVPLKTWSPHVQDWRNGDPTWKDGKGKGLIGAINYLAGKGMNVFSFLTYAAGGDGDNVWPFVERDDKLQYDCSKLDQWGIVFDHGSAQGMYLHFKLSESENSGARAKDNVAMDNGDLGVERKLYCREMIARYGHAPALNWNLGEENTQTVQQQRDMAAYLTEIDPYKHLIVTHTGGKWPGHQRVYPNMLGDQSALTGVSMQTADVMTTHKFVLHWVTESAKAGKPWVVANDEQDTGGTGMPPDPGWNGYQQTEGPDIHATRKYALWGTIMAGGAGVEYYFGYKHPADDLTCEDWRSRDRSWDYCRVALDFFREHKIPFWEMTNANALIGNAEADNSRYCFAKPGELYLVYLPEGGTCDLELPGTWNSYRVQWFNPRTGGPLQDGATGRVAGGKVSLGEPPADKSDDWLAVIRKL